MNSYEYVRVTHLHGLPIVVVRFIDKKIDTGMMTRIMGELDFIRNRNPEHDIVLNFCNVEQVSGSIVNDTVQFLNSMRSASREVVLCCLTPEVRQTFDSVWVDTLVPMVESENVAVIRLAPLMV